MPGTRIENLFDLALQHQRAGRLKEAEAAYRQVLAAAPHHVDALQNLGLIVQQTGRTQLAVELIGKAVQLRPGYARAVSNLARALQDNGQIDEAVATARRAIGLKPALGEAFNNLASALIAKGEFDEAISACRQAIAINPKLFQAYGNLGTALTANEQFSDAIGAYRQLIALKPDVAQAHFNLGDALTKTGRLDDAIAEYRRAVELKPDYVECLTELGCALQTKGFVGLAIEAYRKALALNPELGEAHGNLGNALRDKGELDEAIAHHQRAIVLMPNSALAQNNLGSALLGRAELDDAIAAYKRALELKPGYADADSNLILALLYRSGDDDALIASQCCAWSDAHVRPHRFEVGGHANERSPDRRLRIGYVSGDLRRHPVGYFLQPLLEHHDRGNFEVFGYSNSRISDEHTKSLRAFCDVWRDVVDLPDEQAASQIREDAIDVLIDLGAHTRDNRLMVLARKPAPVQVAHLAYPARIGLESFDYRFTDPYLDPPGEEPAGERIFRLPHTYWCYVPPMEPGEIAPPPMSRAGFITFGCLNNFAKVSAAALEVWRKILVAVPESRLLLHALEGSHRDRVWEMFLQARIDRGRVSFVGWMSSKEHMEQYQRIDIALDPFPFAGGTTTCNALWMGVPVVTLAGRTSIGRGGVSILSTVGLTELIAGDREEYVRIAAELAGDARRLNEYRVTMREKMRQSPLMDGEAYARGIEGAYRELWRKWCCRQP